ncbi:VENN motif pre-toxin domain-containing protein [Serratia sp. IR-2025]
MRILPVLHNPVGNTPLWSALQWSYFYCFTLDRFLKEQLNNQSAAAGGLGAGGGELTARYIAGQLFPDKTAEQLSESEKQQVSALSQLAAGLAGGLATGDTAGAVTGG